MEVVLERAHLETNRDQAALKPSKRNACLFRRKQDAGLIQMHHPIDDVDQVAGITAKRFDDVAPRARTPRAIRRDGKVAVRDVIVGMPHPVARNC